LTLFVVFERFLSDLFLAYLNRNFSTYQNELAARVRQSVQDKFGNGVAPLISVRLKQHVSVAELEGIVDPDGFNLTFTSARKLKEVAGQWLVSTDATRIRSITAHEARLIDTSRAIRNFIAHQSPRAKVQMNMLLSTVESGAHNRHLGRGSYDVHAVGSYLKAVFPAGRRLHLYAAGLRHIGSHI
jgi:hypothetical protein